MQTTQYEILIRLLNQQCTVVFFVIEAVSILW